MNHKVSTKTLADAGIFIALSLVLGRIKLFTMPAGGSVTAGSMIPLFLFSIKWGWKNGVVVGFVYGIIDALLGGYIIHPAQFFLDYPIAYGCLGLSGLKIGEGNCIVNWVPGIAIGLGGRLIAHIFSAVIFFSSTLPPTVNPWINGIIYNGTFLVPELIIAVVILALIWKPLSPYFKLD